MAGITEAEANKDAYLDALKDKVFHGEEKRLLLHILSFIEWDGQTISSHQQTCKRNREWKSAELLKLKEQWLSYVVLKFRSFYCVIIVFLTIIYNYLSNYCKRTSAMGLDLLWNLLE